jgi:hypothetical protein
MLPAQRKRAQGCRRRWRDWDGLVSHKPEHTPAEEKKKRKRKKKTPQTITRALAPIRLLEANPGKLEALDALMAVYLPLCQHYTTLFCESETDPDKYRAAVCETELSERLHRVAIQQAAGIAKSWRTNRQAASDAYLEDVADYAQARTKAEAEGRLSTFKRKEPHWREWKVPVLRVPVLQANANVVVVEKSEDSTFDYWLRISTLSKGTPLRVPVKLAPYHQEMLKDRPLNTSTTLHKRHGVWWLTLSFDQDVPLRTEPTAPVVGVDVGIVHFLTTSTNQEYGSFHGKMARAHKRDRQKRRHKAKLRACLEKQGVPKEQLPSTSSATGQRLSRRVKQEINRAVNELLKEHPDARIIYEDLHVASMRFKARAMNAYLYASNPFTHPRTDRLGDRQTRDGSAHGQSRLFFPGMSTLPLCGSREPAHSENLQMRGLWLRRPCRSQGSGDPGGALGGSGTGGVSRQKGGQGPLACAA